MKRHQRAKQLPGASSVTS
ncbi:hypothetical protein HaLaN_16812, partial [Haematococcus lacustris]